MPKNSVPTIVTGKEVAWVSGPRTVMYVLSWYLDTTISQWLMAMESKSPGHSLFARQILSTKGESDSLSSSVKIIFLHHMGSKFSVATSPSKDDRIIITILLNVYSILPHV